jgi:hypothetical protein
MPDIRQTNEVIDWVFTFGSNHAHANCYHIIRGTHDEARKKMFHRFGQKWAMQYENKEQAGVDFFNLKEIK